jgi:antitoxin HicB
MAILPEETFANVQDAIVSWIEAADEVGRSIPRPSRKLALG